MSGPLSDSSKSLSLNIIGSTGSLKMSKGSARLIVTFLNTLRGLLRRNLMISIPIVPTTVAVVVAIAGMILPAISLIWKLSFYSML